MTKDEELAMDLALEALEKSTDNFPANVQHRKAITAIKQARSAPVQEPLSALRSTIANDAWAISFQSLGQYRTALLKLIDATPPAAHRQWVGLTDEQIKRIGKLDLDSDYFGLWYDFAKAIEAKLKELNT